MNETSQDLTEKMDTAEPSVYTQQGNKNRRQSRVTLFLIRLNEEGATTREATTSPVAPSQPSASLFLSSFPLFSFSLVPFLLSHLSIVPSLLPSLLHFPSSSVPLLFPSPSSFLFLAVMILLMESHYHQSFDRGSRYLNTIYSAAQYNIQ